MAKKKGKSPRPIITSRERAQARMRENENQKIREVAEQMQRGNVVVQAETTSSLYPEANSVNLVAEKEVEISPATSGEIKDSFREKSIKAHEEAIKLPDSVYRLFELTRDGKEMTDDYRSKLIHDPEVSGDDVYNAIKLGFEAGPHTFFSKER